MNKLLLGIPVIIALIVLFATAGCTQNPGTVSQSPSGGTISHPVSYMDNRFGTRR
ncbi:MAG: hypothetical protein WC342_07815 [Methanoregula sp.]|jgi:hypothetical protein